MVIIVAMTTKVVIALSCHKTSVLFNSDVCRFWKTQTDDVILLITADVDARLENARMCRSGVT